MKVPEDTTDINEIFVKRRTLVAPWKNVAEFKKVYQWLFGDGEVVSTPDTRRLALSQMRVWALRRSNLCPAAVLATSVILRVQLQDAEGCQNLQVLYASAFTRFFNFMSSIMQTHNMRTMYETAQHLGLQSFVVDLRHICAHGQELPPLDLLRSTATYCLEWLHDYYWREQYTLIKDVDASQLRRKDKTQFEQNLSCLFGIYDAAIECYMRGARNIKNCKSLVHGKRFKQLKEYYDSMDLLQLYDIFDLLSKELNALVKREVAIKDSMEIFIEAMLQMSYFFKMAYKHNVANQFELLLDATRSLFRMLAINGYIDAVFHKFLQLAENPSISSAKSQGVSFWATQIANGFVALRKIKQMYKGELDENPNFKALDFSKLNTDTNLSDNMRMLLIHTGIDQKRTLLFGDTVRRPQAWVFEREFFEERLSAVNEFTAPILKSLLPLIEPALADEKIEALSLLCDTYLDCYKDTTADKNMKKDITCDNSYDENDLIKKLQKKRKCQTELPTQDETRQFGIWSISQDDETHNWATCPLGRLPWE